jgi:hypothetical protein
MKKFYDILCKEGFRRHMTVFDPQVYCQCQENDLKAQIKLPGSEGGRRAHRGISGNRRGGGVRVIRQKVRYLVLCFILF